MVSKKKRVSKRSEKKVRTRSIGSLVSIIIPVLLFGYLVALNLLVDTSTDYEITDFSPSERFNQTDTLNITQNLVYFNVPMKGADSINLQIALQSEDDVSLGARNREDWSYLYKPLLIKNLDLSNYERTAYGYKISEYDTVIASEKDIKPLPNYPSKYNNQTTIYTTQLRGGHKFLLYAENNLYLKISKRDLNWYDNEDSPEVTIKRYDTIISNGTIPDDGEVNESEPSNSTEYIEFDLPVSKGIYEVEVQGFDGIITEIVANTNKLVVKDRLFLADSELYFGYQPASVYFKPERPFEVRIYAVHDQAKQNISINNRSTTIKESGEWYFTTVTNYTKITPEKNNLIFEYNGYASLTKNSFFIPFQNVIVPLNTDLQFVDKIITDYNQPIKKDEYYVTNVTFNIDDDNLTLINDELSLVFNVKNNTNVKSVKATVIREGLI